MSTLQELPLEPKRYGIFWSTRIMYFILALFFAGADGFLYVLTQREPAEVSTPLLGLMAVIALFVLYFLLSMVRNGLTLDHESISLTAPLHATTIRLEDVSGRRDRTSNKSPYTTIEGRGPSGKSIDVSSKFKIDNEFRAWMAALPDLDELDRQNALEEIEHSAELGGSPEERLAHLQKARNTAIALTLLGVASAALMLLLRHSLDLRIFRVLGVLLAALPWIALFLHGRSPLLYSVLPNKKDPRAYLVGLPLLGAFGLMLDPLENSQVSPLLPLLEYACVPAVVLTVLLYRTARPSLRKGSLLIPLLALSMVYGVGVVRLADMQFDPSTPQPFRLKVLSKTFSKSSKGGISYYIRIHPVNAPETTDSPSISQQLWDSLQAGDSVCGTAHEGALHIAWHTLQACDGQR